MVFSASGSQYSRQVFNWIDLVGHDDAKCNIEYDFDKIIIINFMVNQDGSSACPEPFENASSYLQSGQNLH